MRRIRALPAVLALTLVCLVAGAGPASAAVVFTRPKPLAPPSTWNPGKALAATSHRLLAAWASDCPPPTGVCATDAGPRMGVFVQRAAASDRTPVWSKPVRLSSKKVQAERATIAASGSLAIVGWVTQASYLHPDPAKPRRFQVRVSVNGGKNWQPARTLSPPTGRVDYPRVAVGGGRLYAVWTDANSGAIRLAISDDRGATWTVRTIGTTTSRSTGWVAGYAGLPDIGAGGDDLAVVWYSSAGGQQVALTSASGGTDLGPTSTPVVLTTASPNDGVRYPGAGSSVTSTDPRVALAYTTADALEVQVFDGTGLSGPITVASWPVTVGTVLYDAGYGPAVLPLPDGGIAVAFAGCRHRAGLTNPCDPLASGARIDVLYTESGDGGATWSPLRPLTDASHLPYRVNDEPSLAWTNGIRRVAYDRYQPSFTDYRVWLRSGS